MSLLNIRIRVTFRIGRGKRQRLQDLCIKIDSCDSKIEIEQSNRSRLTELTISRTLELLRWRIITHFVDYVEKYVRDNEVRLGDLI